MLQIRRHTSLANLGRVVANLFQLPPEESFATKLKQAVKARIARDFKPANERAEREQTRYRLQPRQRSKGE